LEIADNNMVGAIRIVSVERGFDPREFVLVPFGGAGPLHGGSLARLLGIKEMLIPPAPGVLSALGLLVSDLKAEFSRTFVQRPDGNLPILARDYADLEKQAADWFEAEKIPETSRQQRRMINLRYKNQGFELTVEWSGEAIDQPALDRTIQAFHDLHERLYSFAQTDVPVEITNLRVDAIGTFEKPQLPEAPTTGTLAEAIAGSVSMALDDGTRIQAPVYDRKKLARDMVIEGPCVVTQLDTTVYILPDQRATVHKSGSLLIKDLLVD
jgi:N-methylhydantoinase A